MVFMIEILKDKCIGCGACASVCSDNWDIVEESQGYKAVPKKTKVDEIGCNNEAADVCPVDAIVIKEE